MAADLEQKTQVGFRGPASIPIHKSSIPLPQNNDPSYYQNQLQFNMQTPYSINSLASNFAKPCPLVIEKVIPVTSRSSGITHIHEASVPSSPASSIPSSRLHFAVQLAKMDAKKIKEQRDIEGYNERNQTVSPAKVAPSKNLTKTTKIQDSRRQPGSRQNFNKLDQHKLVENKDKKEKGSKRNVHGYHFYPKLDSNPDHAVDKQTREIRRLEKEMHKYLEKLDELINKGQEVIQKKDKRLRKKDDVSHLSDDDTDPRQYERADEQATRSARVLYMIERQIRELDDELRKKGKNIRQGKKSQTLSRLAAAQRATVRALQMLINSAPLQPKGSRHYPLMYQELTSLIQQLSLLSIQLESDSALYLDKKPQVGNRDDLPFQTRKSTNKRQEPPGRPREESKFEKQAAFNHELAQNAHGLTMGNVSNIHPDDSALTIDPTPERSATLKAGLEALLRAKQQEQKPANIVSSGPVAPKKKAVLLPSSLQAKRRKANLAVQKTIRIPGEAGHFAKETTASRLKKVDKQRGLTKQDRKEDEKGVHDEGKKSVGTSPGIVPMMRFDDVLQEKEIQRQVWLEDETKRKLREVMGIPQQLVSEAEEAIKMKLKPLLEQAQVVVDSSKNKPIEERFVDLASKVTMKESEALSEMILDDVLIDTAEELQRLDEHDATEIEEADLQDSSTLENILQRLEQFEREEESIRRHLTQVTYDDPCEEKLAYQEQKGPQEIQLKPMEDGSQEAQPIVIESTTFQPPKFEKTTKRPEFYTSKDEQRSSSAQHTRLTMNSTRNRPTTYPRPLGRLVDQSPVHLFLPPKIQDNVFSYRQKYSDYLEETSAHHHGTFDPWKVVETLSDDILDDVVKEVASEFCGACDDVTELIFQSEFTKE